MITQRIFTLIIALALAIGAQQSLALDYTPEKIPGAKQRNVVFILSDDHRYDVMGFMGHPYVETPNMDDMAARGVHFKNAFVTTSLCSPSRASILTGLYMHSHNAVDNQVGVSEGTRFFPEYLQVAGYKTAFIGKWHMGGGDDEPRAGFDQWVSFKGQGKYYPPATGRWSLNVNGKHVPQKGYITDELTDYAIDWLDTLDDDQPFFLYLSHKGVHGMFEPAKRHLDRYKNEPFPEPATMANTPANNAGKPMWLQNQRNSWHGVDFAYHQDTNIADHYRLYCETLLSVDDSIGRVRHWLKDNGLDQDTLVIYMGDNGFQWGEHGLIDKRTAYEESMRVPMLAYCPDLFKPGTVVEGVVAGIDIGPTSMEAAGLKTPDYMDGASYLKLAAGQQNLADWRDYLMYEYYWEFAYPHTPTTFALRGNDYKFIQYHGVWDTDELYDIQNDPNETRNLIYDPAQQKRIATMRRRLHDILEEADGARVPFSFKRNQGSNLRKYSGSKAAEFPPEVMRTKDRNQ